MAAFSNKAAQYHAGDLFDIESVTLDITEHTNVLEPNLALNFSTPLSNVSGAGEHMDCSNVYTEEQLAPLFRMLGKLQRLVDDRTHLQQAAGTNKVGYNAYYDHKLTQINGLANFSGTRADKKFWAHDQNDTEKEILRIKAHEKQLSLVSPNKGDGNPKSKSARSRHNKC